MCTSEQLKELLEEISEDVKFFLFQYNSSEKFQVRLRCNVKPNQTVKYYRHYVKHWIHRFARSTNTVWRVRGSYPDGHRYLFMRTYGCHQSVQMKKETNDNTHCKASIDFRVKLKNDKTMTDPYLEEGLNMSIHIECVHTHSLKDTHRFTVPRCSLDCSSVDKSPFNEYFDEGYTPLAARCYNALRLIEKYGRDSEQLLNPNLNPSLQNVRYLYKRRPTRNEKDVNEVIIKKIETLEQSGHTIRYNENPQFVIILTPLMKRVISQIGVGRVLVDTTVEPGAPSTLFLYVPSMVGSLPVTCVVFTEETEAIYLQIFLTIKLAIESEIGVNFAPELLLQDNPKIKQPLLTVFSNSMIKYNRFSLCRELWQWIFEEGYFMNTDTTLNAMVFFKSLVFAKSLHEASIIHNSLICSDMPGKYFKKVYEIWQNQQEWLDDSALCDGFNDAPICFMKEFILQLCKPFTGILPAMLNIVTDIIERHYHKILLSHKDGNVTSTYTTFIAKERVDPSSEALRKVGPNEYRLQNGINSNRYFQVITDPPCCDCHAGQKGRTCEHLCAILNLSDDIFVSFSSLDIGEKNTFLGLLGDDITIKIENEHDLLDIDENAVDDERSMQSSSSKSSDEKFGVEENHEDASFDLASEDTYKQFKEQYDASLKSVNDEFLRLNIQFRDNPNGTNLYTMQRLATELAKIVVVEGADLSNTFVTLNGTSGAGES